MIACFVATDLVSSGAPGAPIGTYTTKSTYSFVSAPGLHPPRSTADVPTTASDLAPGYILVTNFYDVTSPPMVGQSGPLILDNSLQPVWFEPVPTNVVATNLSLQTYDAKPALAWWQGVVTSTGATESGEDVVVNQHYKTVATLKGVDGWIVTLHSLQIRGDDAWVTANKNIPMDLTRYGGARNGALVDSAVQEYDLETGKLVQSWDALDHIPLADSYAPPPDNGFPWDAYHVNSIDVTDKGTFLVSMRNTWAAYLVDAGTGRIEWVLGGKHSSFKFGSNAEFQWQHDVMLAHSSEVTLFDDECCEITGAGTYLAATGPSRAVVLRLNQARHLVTLVAQYRHAEHLCCLHGQHQSPSRTATSSSAGVSCPTSPSTPGQASCSWTRSSRRPTSATGQSRSRIGLGFRTTRPVAPQGGATARPPCTPAGTAQPRSLPGGFWQERALSTWPWWRTGRSCGFETAIQVDPSYKVFKVEALDTTDRVIASSSQFELDT